MKHHHLNVHLEVKEIDSRMFAGHGSVFGNVDLGGDVVMPGAFKKSLARQKGGLPPMFWMHNPDQVPGVWKEMREDDRGLYVEGELVDTQLGNEMRTLLQKKAVRGMSIGYQAADIGFDTDGNRLLKEVDLWEVSIVSMAMNPLAQVTSAKSRLSAIGEYIPTEREFERLLRDVGCSKATAKRVVATLDFDERMDSGGTLDPRWDAGDEEAQQIVIAALKNLEDSRICGVMDLKTRINLKEIAK